MLRKKMNELRQPGESKVLCEISSEFLPGVDEYKKFVVEMLNNVFGTSQKSIDCWKELVELVNKKFASNVTLEEFESDVSIHLLIAFHSF